MLLNSDILKIISILYEVLIGTVVAYSLAARQQTQVLLGLSSALVVTSVVHLMALLLAVLFWVNLRWAESWSATSVITDVTFKLSHIEKQSCDPLVEVTFLIATECFMASSV